MLDGPGTYSTEGFPEFDCMIVACSDEDYTALIVLGSWHGPERARRGGRVVVCGGIIGILWRSSSHSVMQFSKPFKTLFSVRFFKIFNRQLRVFLLVRNRIITSDRHLSLVSVR